MGVHHSMELYRRVLDSVRALSRKRRIAVFYCVFSVMHEAANMGPFCKDNGNLGYAHPVSEKRVWFNASAILAWLEKRQVEGRVKRGVLGHPSGNWDGKVSNLSFGE